MNRAIKILTGAVSFLSVQLIVGQEVSLKEVRLQWVEGQSVCTYTFLMNPRTIKNYLPLLFDRKVTKKDEAGPIVVDVENIHLINGFMVDKEDVRSGLKAINFIGSSFTQDLFRCPISFTTMGKVLRASRTLGGFDRGGRAIDLVALFFLNRELLINQEHLTAIALFSKDSYSFYSDPDLALQIIKSNMIESLEMLRDSTDDAIKSRAREVLKGVHDFKLGKRGTSEEDKNNEAIFNFYFKNKNNPVACDALCSLFDAREIEKNEAQGANHVFEEEWV